LTLDLSKMASESTITEV